jgi:polysaccharide pyruvyl transferase WcaK-like protein
MYRSLMNQLPFVADQTALFERQFCGIDLNGRDADLVRRLTSWLSNLAASPGLHLLVSPVPNKVVGLWREALNAAPNLHVHPVLLVRHPLEISGRDGDAVQPVRRILDWCASIALADELPNCHLTSFDELLADPLSSFNGCFQTIPDRRLMLALSDTQIRDRLLLESQPAKRRRIAVESTLAGDHRFRVFSSLYAYLQAQRLFQPEQLRGLMRLVFSLVAPEGASELGVLQQARLCVQPDGVARPAIPITAPLFAEDASLDDNLSHSVQQLQPKQHLRECLLKIVEDARKGKQLIAAATIYRFLLFVEPQSPAALFGHALTLNDMKQWGEAMPSWEALFAILDQDGSSLNAVQRNGRNACVKALTNDIGYVLQKPIGDVSDFREHIVQTPGDNGHVAFMRAWTYLGDRSGEQARALLVNDTRTQVNIGCYTTTNELLRGFADAGFAIDHTITLIELALLADLLFANGPLEQGSDFNIILHRFVSRPEFHAYRKLIAQHETMVVNGEGSFYDQQRKGLILCILMVFAKQYCSSRVYCINHSADLHDKLMRRWTYRAYQHCDYIAVREHISFARFPEEFGCFNIRVVPDAAYGVVGRNENAQSDWFHGLDQLFSKSITQPYVVVSGTSAIFRGDREGFFTHHVLAFNNLLRAIHSMGFQLVLLASDNTDYKLLRQAAIELNLPLVSPTANIDSVLSLFHGATAFISGRWHTSIIAACAGCPSILGDANFFKTSALHDFYRYPWPMFDYRNLDNDKAKILVAIQNSRSENLRRQVSDWAKESALQVTEMFKVIFDDLRMVIT